MNNRSVTKKIQQHTTDFKLTAVRQVMAGQASWVTATEFGISRRQLKKWLRLAENGNLPSADAFPSRQEQVMTDREYETLVRDLMHKLVTNNQELKAFTVSGGIKAPLIIGKSGFGHQIDVAVEDSCRLLLVECKYWKRPVDAEAVLTLASRISDIAANRSEMEIHGSIVSKQPATKGTLDLANYFGIKIDMVISPREFGFGVFDHLSLSIEDRVSTSDSCSAVFTSVASG